MSDFFHTFFHPGVIWVLIPIVAIICSFVHKGLKMHYEHKERMARIEFGLEPEEALSYRSADTI